MSLEVVLRYLRRFEELPDHTDKIFVVDEAETLVGVLPLNKLLISDPETEVAEVMARDVVTFLPEDDVGDAARAFERYDLVSAPVVASAHPDRPPDVDDMVDYIREESESEVLELAVSRKTCLPASGIRCATAGRGWPLTCARPLSPAG